MKLTKKHILGLLILVGLVYFIAFIPPNLTGAKDANMLAVFEVDEYAQYPNAIERLIPGDTLYQTVRNFLIYLHYFYGYPFYFFSSLVLLGLRLFLGEGWLQQTQLIMVTLRQAINVLPMLVALILLVYMQTRFESWLRSLLLFLGLLFVPVVVVNNFWWHPDSLVFIFIVLTIFFLQRDDLRFGRNFFFAAAACGLAIGTKHLGIFFALAIPVYLVYGLVCHRLLWKTALAKATLFVVVMVAAVLFSNPLLLLPMERAEIINIQILQVQQTSVGILLANSSSFFEGGQYPQDFQIHYGEAWFVLLSFVALGIGIARRKTRLLNVIILAWMIPMSLTVLNVGTRRTHYFLPVMLPLCSCLVNLFPPLLQKPGRWLRVGQALAALLLVFQFAIFMRTDIDKYITQVNREKNSPSLAFTQRIEKEVFAKISQQNLTIYRDWRIYLPPKTGWRIEMNWDMATHAYIAELNPDVIILESENVNLFASQTAVDQAVNAGNMQLVHEFYRDAMQNKLSGYRLVVDEDFGIVLVRENLLR